MSAASWADVALQAINAFSNTASVIALAYIAAKFGSQSRR